MTDFQLIIGDCLEELKKLPDESVHCCITSPPYWGLRDYGVDGQIGLEDSPEAFVEKMVSVFREVRRVLRDDGTLWLNLGDSYAGNPGGYQGKNGQRASRTFTARILMPKKADSIKPKDLVGIPWRVAFALQADGWYLRQDIIWHKPNPMPESVQDRCTKSHEYIFLLAKSRKYYFDKDSIKEPRSENTHARRPGNGVGFGHGYEDRGRNRVTYKTPDGWDTSKGAGGHGSIHKAGREKGRKLGEQNSGIKNNASMDEALSIMPDHRNKRSVWTVATQAYKDAHFATFPTALIEPCVLAGAPPPRHYSGSIQWHGHHRGGRLG